MSARMMLRHLFPAACAALVLSACSEPSVITAPPTLRPLPTDPRLTLLDPGAAGLIVVCSSGGASSFTVSASPATGTLLGSGSFSLADGACANAWTAGAGDLTITTITVTQTAGSFGYIEATAVPPTGLPYMTVNQSTKTVTWLTNADHGGSATFFQNAPPPPPPKPKKVVLCKEGPEGTYSFTVSAAGGTGDNVFPSGTSVTIAAGECKDVWTTTLVPPPGVGTTVTITEDGTAPLDSIVQALDYAPPSVITGTRSVSSLVNFYHGAVITYYNAFPPPTPALGRMTGGGGQIRIDELWISRGFTIHCDITLSNNIEINWADNKWHLDKPITSAVCLDDPAFDETPPRAPFNTFIGTAVGRLNGVDGSRLEFTFVDAGEPGKSDRATLKIWDANNNLVLDVPMSALTHGNIQAHYDQPHGSNWNRP